MNSTVRVTDFLWSLSTTRKKRMKFGLGVSSFLIVGFAVTVWHTSAQAPGDEDSQCLNDRSAVGDVYPPDMRMLMDSRNYENLITGTHPHWQQLNVDGTGTGWTNINTWSRLCNHETRACDFRETTSQENWFFTQYINYLQAREVFVNISAGFTECRLAQNPPCNQLYIDMYRYERNGRNDAVARTTSNYQLIQRVQQPNGFGQRTYQTSFTFIPSGNTNGFYIGFKDTGTCVNIQCIQIYYNEFTPDAPSPVICPETGLPPAGTTASVTCSCPANSVATSSLQMICRPDGTCTGNPRCRCHDGYQKLPQECRACPAGTYHSRSNPADSCLPCPANTITTGVAVAMCPCIAGYFRAPREGPSFSCTKPPAAVRNLRVNSKTNTSIIIQWDTPSVTGRSDYYYNVEHNSPNDISTYKRHNQERITNTNIYNVNKLQPDSEYIIRISVHNGVSGNDSQNDRERRRQVSDTTLEGVPSAPTSVLGLCTVVVWAQPQCTNGQLTGYDLRFYQTNPDSATIVSNRSDEIFRIVKETDVPSDQRGSAYVQVRAKTRAGPGNWSEGVPLDDDDSDVPTTQPIMNTKRTTPPVIITRPALHTFQRLTSQVKLEVPVCPAPCDYCKVAIIAALCYLETVKTKVLLRKCGSSIWRHSGTLQATVGERPLPTMLGSATLGMVLLDMVINSTEIPQFVSGNLTHSHLRGLSTSRFRQETQLVLDLGAH